jgi:hypothetical protein
MVGRCLKMLVGRLKGVVGDLFSCKAKGFSVWVDLGLCDVNWIRFLSGGTKDNILGNE